MLLSNSGFKSGRYDWLIRIGKPRLNKSVFRRCNKVYFAPPQTPAYSQITFKVRRVLVIEEHHLMHKDPITLFKLMIDSITHTSR